MSFDPKRTRDYIRTIDLDGTPRGILAYDAATEDGEVYEKGHTQITVVGSTLLSFAAGIAPELREAVADAVLLAQLVANRQTPAGSPIAWQKADAEVLRNLGWNLEPCEWNDHTAHGKAVEVHDKICEVMAGLTGTEAAALQTVRATMDALCEMETDEAPLAIFNREAKKGKVAHFQIMHVEKQLNGEAHVIALGCALDAQTSIGQVLYFNVKEGGARFHANIRRAVVNRPALLEMAPAIRTKTRPYVADYVSPVLDL